MGIKVFCKVPEIGGYVGSPPDHFDISITYAIYTSDTTEANEYSDTISINFGDTAIDVYAAVYAAILARCAGLSLPTPAKTDIFAYVPTMMAQLLPDLPAMA